MPQIEVPCVPIWSTLVAQFEVIAWHSSGRTQEITLARFRARAHDILLTKWGLAVGHFIQYFVGWFTIFQCGTGIDSGTYFLDCSGVVRSQYRNHSDPPVRDSYCSLFIRLQNAVWKIFLCGGIKPEKSGPHKVLWYRHTEDWSAVFLSRNAVCIIHNYSTTFMS